MNMVVPLSWTQVGYCNKSLKTPSHHFNTIGSAKRYIDKYCADKDSFVVKEVIDINIK